MTEKKRELFEPRKESVVYEELYFKFKIPKEYLDSEKYIIKKYQPKVSGWRWRWVVTKK